MKHSEVSAKEFSRRFLGLHPGQVRQFLDELAGAVAMLEADNDRLRGSLAKAEKELGEHQARRQGLEDTLAQTRQIAEDIKANAEKEAKFIVAEAELQAEKILGQAHNRLAQIHEDISELKRQRAQFEVRLRSLVEAHIKLLDMETDRDRELAELDDKIRILRNPSHS